MRKLILFLSCFILISAVQTDAQNKVFIFSKDGHPIIERKNFIASCLNSLNKDYSDLTALSICNCKADKIDHHFKSSDYEKYTKDESINIFKLINSDSLLQVEFRNCYSNSGKTYLLQAEGSEIDFVAECIRNIKSNTEKKLDIKRVLNFCNCEMEMIKSRKLTDAEAETLNDPNSVLFFETMYKCGDPFYANEKSARNWNQNKVNDIDGPITDTLESLSINGMNYIKLETGNVTQFWLFDTGASDLLISRELEMKFRNECILSDSSYLGIEEFEMANGSLDSCRLYKMDNIKLGKFSINNITIAVSDKGKKNIVGRGLLNKFSYWSLDNKNNTLILNK